jgi:glycosyltransferase involved in cell wall biosynthesis
MLSIVVPVYNEEHRFDIDSWSQLIQSVEDCNWFFVNDGSTDSTSTVLQKLAFENVQVLTLLTNQGKGEAVRQGICCALASRSEMNSALVGYLDCDGAFDFQEIPGMVHRIRSKLFDAGYSVVIASRVKLSGRNIQRNSFRHLIGRVLASYICRGWQSAPYDTQSGFKVFRIEKNYTHIFSQTFITSWFFDIELMIRMEKLNLFQPWEMAVRNWRDVKGSKVNYSQFFQVFVEVIKIRSFVKSIGRQKQIVSDG